MVRCQVHVHAERTLSWLHGFWIPYMSLCVYSLFLTVVLLRFQLFWLDLACCSCARSTLSAHQPLYFTHNISQALAVVNEEFCILRRGECGDVWVWSGADWDKKSARAF